MLTKETGASYYTRCPTCGDELSVGWLRPGDPAVAVVDASKIKAREHPADGQGIARGPEVCGCGNVELELLAATGRARVSWKPGTPEPPLGNVNLH